MCSLLPIKVTHRETATYICYRDVPFFIPRAVILVILELALKIRRFLARVVLVAPLLNPRVKLMLIYHHLLPQLHLNQPM